MANIPMQNPGSTEIQSPIIAGITEALSKLSSTLNLETTALSDVKLSNVETDEMSENKNKIYEAPFDSKLWLSAPAPIIKKNGSPISQETTPYVIDYVGGSIKFQTALENIDVVTASFTCIKGSSQEIANIKNLISQLQGTVGQYKGYFDTLQDLQLNTPTGKQGDFALVATPKLAVYAWNGTSAKWENTQSIEDLSNYYKKNEINDLLDGKEPTIQKQSEQPQADRYYYGGRKSWQDLDKAVRETTLTGLDKSETNQQVEATDNVLTALGKLQGQVNLGLEKHYIEGNSAPTQETVGLVGQRYVNQSNGGWYTCVQILDGKYIWKGGVNAEAGKGLSTNDYTTPEKEKLASLKNYDDTEIKEDILANKQKGVITAQHARVDTINQLVAETSEITVSLFTLQFKATSDFVESDTFTFNGESYTAKPNGEETVLPDKAFVNGDLVSVVVDTESKKLGFKLGGGGGDKYSTLPPPITMLTAEGDNQQITVSFAGVEAEYEQYLGDTAYIIVLKEGSIPESPKDGTFVRLSKDGVEV